MEKLSRLMTRFVTAVGLVTPFLAICCITSSAQPSITTPKPTIPKSWTQLDIERFPDPRSSANTCNVQSSSGSPNFCDPNKMLTFSESETIVTNFTGRSYNQSSVVGVAVIYGVEESLTTNKADVKKAVDAFGKEIYSKWMLSDTSILLFVSCDDLMLSITLGPNTKTAIGRVCKRSEDMLPWCQSILSSAEVNRTSESCYNGLVRERLSNISQILTGQHECCVKGPGSEPTPSNTILIVVIVVIICLGIAAVVVALVVYKRQAKNKRGQIAQGEMLKNTDG